MSRLQIDITKSKKAGRLIMRQWFIEKLFEYLLPMMVVGMFLFMAVMEFISHLENNEPIGLSLAYLILIMTISGFVIWSMSTVYYLKKVNGISRGKNSDFIKKIAEKKEWNISIDNQQMTIINFSWQDSGTDWGKQMTILYDEKDILVNCISFGLFSSPSPFHWFANKRKVNELITEFQNKIKPI